MTSGPRPEAGCTMPPATPTLAAGKKYLALSRVMGKISACIFLLASLAVLDGLQTLVRHEFNEVDLIPGESVLITGMMPQNTVSHTDLVVETDNLPGLTFTATDSFKGFWMGGSMWRASLTADITTTPGKGTLTVVDLVPLKKVGKTTVRDGEAPRTPASQPAPAEKAESPPAAPENPEEKQAEPPMLGQNPTLVYSVVVWPSAAARLAAEHSFVRRFTGGHPFVLAGIAAGLALLCGLGNSLLFSKAEARLALNGVYFIHGIKKKDDGLHAAFAHAGKDDFAPGDKILLYDMRWRERTSCSISEKNQTKGFARFPFTGPAPQYGWLLFLCGGSEKKL